MLCAASPGLGKQFHQWLPQIKERVSFLKEPAVLKDTKEYFTKIYPKANVDDITEYSKQFVQEQKKKMHLAEIYPHLKIADIEVLSQTVTDEDISQYEKDRGN
jgi:acetone carboxylase gamma subunit